MRFYIVAFIVANLLFSCKRKPIVPTPIDPTITQLQDSTLKDFKFVPLNNAKWILNYRGMSYYDSSLWVYDSNYYHTTTILSTGNIKHYKSYYYLVFKVSTKYFGKWWAHTDTGFLYIREDTATQRLYSWCTIMNVTYPAEYKFLNYNIEVGDTTMFNYISSAEISRIDSMPVAGQYCKRWIETHSNGTSSFYQAYGIGGRAGILPHMYTVDGSKLLNMTFFYKSDSVHFNYIN